MKERSSDWPFPLLLPLWWPRQDPEDPTPPQLCVQLVCFSSWAFISCGCERQLCCKTSLWHRHLWEEDTESEEDGLSSSSQHILELRWIRMFFSGRLTQLSWAGCPQTEGMKGCSSWLRPAVGSDSQRGRTPLSQGVLKYAIRLFAPPSDSAVFSKRLTPVF